jgi:hypothetical protein
MSTYVYTSIHSDGGHLHLNGSFRTDAQFRSTEFVRDFIMQEMACLRPTPDGTLDHFGSVAEALTFIVWPGTVCDYNHRPTELWDGQVIRITREVYDRYSKAGAARADLEDARERLTKAAAQVEQAEARLEALLNG